jgi:hypothetical protein
MQIEGSRSFDVAVAVLSILVERGHRPICLLCLLLFVFEAVKESHLK